MKPVIETWIRILFTLLMLVAIVGCGSDSPESSSSSDTTDAAVVSDATDDGDTTTYAIVDTGQDADTFTVYKMFQAEQPAPYSGDFDNVQVRLATRDTPEFLNTMPALPGLNPAYIRYAFAFVPQLASAER